MAMQWKAGEKRLPSLAHKSGRLEMQDFRLAQ
jgi:hypothetical protein